MAKGKDIEFFPSKELENELNESESMKYPKGESKLHQQKGDVNLGKGERGKGSSSPIGKNVSGQQRKNK